MLLWAGWLLAGMTSSGLGSDDAGNAARHDAGFDVAQVVVLEKGPQWTSDDTPELAALQSAHLAHLDAMWKAGQAEVCGPVNDPSGQVQAMCLYTTPNPTIARTWAEQDPIVKAGHLAVKVLPWHYGAGFLAFPETLKGDSHAGHGGSHAAHAPANDSHGDDHGGDHATVRHRFDDVDRWTQIFDDPSRDSWQRPAAVVEALALRKGMAVADIGSGTGYFNPYLAAAVGKKGRVVAVDVERNLVDHMAARAVKEGTPQVAPRLGRFEDPGLLPGEVDRILMVDTYHHIDGRKGYFKSLRSALRPGGQLVVVDFKPGPLPVGPPPGHKLSPEQVMGELEAAGWRFVARHEVLPHQYVLVFEPAMAPE